MAGGRVKKVAGGRAKTAAGERTKIWRRTIEEAAIIFPRLEGGSTGSYVKSYREISYIGAEIFYTGRVVKNLRFR